MNLTFDANTLSQEEQKKLYLWLKAKFDPGSSVVSTDMDFRKEVMLNKDLDELSLRKRVNSCLRFSRITNLKELCKLRRSDLLKITGLGVRSCDEIQDELAKLGLSLKDE